MRMGFVGSLIALLAGAGLSLAQPDSSIRTVLSDTKPTSPTPAVKQAAAELRLPELQPKTSSATAVPESAPLVPPPDGTMMWSDTFPATFPDDNSVLKKNLPCGCAWISADYLMWWMRGQKTPPLVTTGPATVPPAQFGTLGSPGTHVLFGGNDLPLGMASGIRINGGLQSPNHELSIDGGVFVLEQRSTGIGTISTAAGNPIIARPFIDVTSGMSSRLLTSGPSAFAGSLIANASTRLFGGEANLTRATVGLLSYECETNLELDVLAGFRYLDLNETLAFSQRSVILPGGFSGFAGRLVFAPNEVRVSDEFDDRNQFYGPQLGATVEYQHYRFYYYGALKVGLGVVHEVSSVIGTTTLVAPNGVASVVPGGLLALPTNIGRRTHNEFATVPELDLNLGYQLCRNIRLSVGYDFLYWNLTGRPGDQVNDRINVTQLPTSPAFAPISGPALPAPQIHRNDFYVHGVNFTLAYHY
jgi:hypothetical protein